jgi:2,3-diketo-5-methylthio-1-phosphopentane phosphatase
MIRVFCDFDGTVVPLDVGNALFKKFAGQRAEEIVERYLGGLINARECYRLECLAVDSLDRNELLSFVDQFQPDSHFQDFERFCSGRGIPVTIVSDGFDVYVDRILASHGFSHVPRFANHLEFVSDDGRSKLVPSFPHRDAECEQCANCKRNHILNLSADDDIVVYVGDGFSDRCPVRYADIVFARKSLIRYCQEQNISYVEFRHFGEVREKLEAMIGRKQPKQRREAVMARRAVFQQG